MSRSAKHLLAVLLAIFAMAAMSLSAVQAGTMAIEMSGMADGMNAPGDCVTPCPGEQDDADAMACPPVCVAPAVAVLPSAKTVAVASTSSTYAFTTSPRLGRESLPDPYPPRTRGSV
ncbi:hypothetical protein [Neoaquamicrobium sediminum]|uniref:hypothetical protein n=1 Tax=Neoaquamicrobium sediminum TaxID=1849104 RepID=UPI00156742F9|nr:hypothetical protein [Mesorhizobium sediminum]NRC56580.1 hypothetical protein [Mesorhizobium sediminum]